MTTVNPPASDEFSHDNRKKLSGLLGFAEGVLTARTKVQMSMQAGLGVFHEGDVAHLPGVHLHCDDGAWLRIDRQQETRPPEAVDYVARFFAATPSDPSKPPKLKPAIQVDVTIEEASDLEEAGLLNPEDVHVIVEDGIEVENRVKVILHADNCPEMRRDFERYMRGEWADWAHAEKPMRRAIAFYNDLFKIHSVIHTSEGTPPELVWGIGIGRWEVGSEKIDMPIIEHLVDIELEDGGAISIRPRELPPQLSLKPYLEVEVEGSPKLQRDLQERLGQILMGEQEFSPFTTLWEPLLDTAASNLAPSAVHITRAQLDEGASLAAIGKELRVNSSWAIFGRPRSIEARVQDLAALRKQIDDETATVPASIRRYATTPHDEPKSTTSSFGLNTAVIGATKTPPEPSATGGASMGRVPGAGSTRKAEKSENGRKVHFFPLPYNEEQGTISDMIDDAKVHVVGVSGPPGTGKSHTIANIISHQMAMGNRVLVTARTPEAIAAVREKLPLALQPLVIASVGTDRDSAQQLQDAVSELSREVVTLNEQDAEDQMHRLEALIVACDETAEEADAALAEIARANLAQMTWDGAQHTPMDLVDILAAGEEAHGWFTDRPSKPPPAQLDETIGRLATAMPALAADAVYAGADLPAADALPGTAELVAAHDAELAWSRREIIDYSSAPPMAPDSAGAESQARQLLSELLALSNMIAIADANVRGLAVCALRDHCAINRSAIEATHNFLGKQRALDQIATVRFEIGACGEEDFTQAATRGASGQKPVGFGLFNGALKSATASVRVNGKNPSSPGDWQSVLEACRLQQTSVKIADTLRPFVSEQIMPALPSRPWEIARHLKDRQAELEAALDIATRLKPVIDALEALFPYGLDSEAIETHLDCSDAIFVVPLRVPKASERFDPPLADVYIAGPTRHGKTNASEARWIVDEIARLIEDPAHEGRDIGVISLIGNEQAERIGRMLVEDERIGPEQIEKRRIIYGDARTMQGQERSIVFLSMVATPGHATAQTSKADQQRINVAMSRAKDRLYLVRSVSLEDLKPTDIKAHILQHFADPMPEGRAATGKETANLMDRCDSGFEREVLKRLMDVGYRVRPQVAAGGFRIDLVVEGTEDRRLAIELDGDQYHGPDVWDRDMARQAALERAGWIFWRVFGSQWKSNREFWWDSLIETLDRIGIDPIGSGAVDERFTETIVVDPWGTAGSTPDDTEEAEAGATDSGEDAGAQGAAAPEAPVDHDRAASPDSTGTDTFPATAREDTADPMEKFDAGHSDPVPPSADEEPGAPSKNAKTTARHTGAGPLRRADQQQRLPLEDDLFSFLAPASPDDDRKPAADVLKGGDLFALSAAEGDAGPGRVGVGSTVRLEKLGNGGGKLEITIVEDGHNAAHGMIGIHTPLAQALLEAELGEEVEYRSGSYLQEVRILAIS